MSLQLNSGKQMTLTKKTECKKSLNTFVTTECEAWYW